jgi:chromosome segregation ATPase
MSEHKSVLEELKKSKALVAQMGKDAKPLEEKIDKIIAEMERALQFRDGYKTAQTKAAELKKVADEEAKKVDAAKAKNDALHAKHLEAAKEIEKWAATVEKWQDVLKKNKAIEDAVGRLKLWSVSALKTKYEFWDEEGYQALIKNLQEKRKLLPKPDASNKLPQDLGVLESKVDTMVKELQEAAALAKAAKPLDKVLTAKKAAYEELQKKVHPIEDALDKFIGQTVGDLNAAKEIRQNLDHTGSTEAYRRSEAVAKILNDASEDFAPGGKVLDAKSWAAIP